MPSTLASPPLFLFGFERSGTTLLSMMVGSHPAIAVPFSTTGLWYRYAARLGSYGTLERAENRMRLVDDLLREERLQLWDERFSAEEVLDGIDHAGFSAVIERFHRLYAQRKGKPCWGNIDIATLYEMDTAHGLFPDARFVHIVRDGRDVALSHETYEYGIPNTLECAERWAHDLRTNLKMGAILGPVQYKVVRYEDLLLETEATLKDLCSYIGVPYSPQMLDYPRMVEEKIPDSKRSLWPALDSPPLPSKAYGWRNRMSATKRIVFESVANGMLKELGYEAFDKMPKSAAAYLYELFCYLGRGGRYRRLAAKLGRAPVLRGHRPGK